MKKLTLALAALLMLSAMTASGCVVRDGLIITTDGIIGDSRMTPRFPLI